MSGIIFEAMCGFKKPPNLPAITYPTSAFQASILGVMVVMFYVNFISSSLNVDQLNNNASY